jgi:UDP-galactopyranose mutase
VNHPDAPGFTRVTEYRHITGQEAPGTTLSREFPEAHVPGRNEPYYPVPAEEARILYRRYARLAREEAPDALFAGRLADYKYYNMDQAVARALRVCA